MQTDKQTARTAAAVEAAARNHALVAANDPKKLRRSLRVVRAALDQGVITLDDVTDRAPLEVSA